MKGFKLSYTSIMEPYIGSYYLSFFTMIYDPISSASVHALSISNMLHIP